VSGESAPALIPNLLQLAEVTARIRAHMTRWRGHSSPEAPPPDVVLHELLTETLAPLLDRHPAAAAKAATAILADAVEMIEAEILLVEPPRRTLDRPANGRFPRPPN
jgi:hypothetical protein